MRFDLEHREELEEDILDKLMVRTYAQKEFAEIDQSTYMQRMNRLDQLKKLEFTREWEALEDPTVYEWMKLKLASDIGDAREAETFAQYEEYMQERKGEDAFS